MLSHLHLTNFTVFSEASFTFCPGLNVIIGENGTGKTHLLKAGFLAANGWPKLNANGKTAGKEKTAAYFAEQLSQLFKPDRIGSLNSHKSGEKTLFTAEITPAQQPPLCWKMSFSAKAESKIAIDDLPDETQSAQQVVRSVYLPSKEMVSFFEGFIALTDRHELPFDGTYRDLALNLSSPRLKIDPPLLTQQLSKLGDLIGGTLQLEGGRFYLVNKQGNKREVALLAEGIRKIATLFHLIANGSLEQGASLFWDEPDANMNPKLVKIMAKVLWNLVNEGIQVIVATHSLFLLRELEILSNQQPFADLTTQVFALSSTANNVVVSQGKTANDVDSLVLLDEELAQSDRYMAAS